jgi:transcriptional regulator with XRE-family HTH domain
VGELERDETFTERFNRLTANMTDGQLMDQLGLTMTALRKIKDGTTRTLKLRGGLRLARYLGVSPWYLICEPEPRDDASRDAALVDQLHDDLVEEMLDEAVAAALKRSEKNDRPNRNVGPVIPLGAIGRDGAAIEARLRSVEVLTAEIPGISADLEATVAALEELLGELDVRRNLRELIQSKRKPIQGDQS